MRSMPSGASSSGRSRSSPPSARERRHDRQQQSQPSTASGGGGPSEAVAAPRRRRRGSTGESSANSVSSAAASGQVPCPSTLPHAVCPSSLTRSICHGQDSDSSNGTTDGRRAANKRRAASPSPPTAALIAQITAEDAAALKRARRVRPLDADRPLPVLVEGRQDDATIRELLSLPGLPVVEDPEIIRTTLDFIRLVQSQPDASLIAAPGMVLTEFDDVAPQPPATAAAQGQTIQQTSVQPIIGPSLTLRFLW